MIRHLSGDFPFTIRVRTLKRLVFTIGLCFTQVIYFQPIQTTPNPPPNENKCHHHGLCWKLTFRAKGVNLEHFRTPYTVFLPVAYSISLPQCRSHDSAYPWPEQIYLDSQC